MIIYKTTNLITGKIYVGQDSKNNSKYLGSGKYISKSIKKYGGKNFIKEILCECSSREELNEKERYWIKDLCCKVPNGYNISDGGEGRTGPMTEETKIKLRKPLGPMSEEHKKNHKLSLNTPVVQEKLHKPCGPMSEEIKQNMKIAQNKPEVLSRKKEFQVKRYKNPAEKLKQSERMKIVANRPEVLEKNRRPKGPMSEEQKELRRKPMSEEQKQLRRRPMSEETKKNHKASFNRSEVKEKMRKPKSEEGKRNIKLGQQKRRERDKIQK